MPIGLETSSRPSPVTRRPSDLTISFETSPRDLDGLPDSRDRPRPFALEAEPEPVAAVDELGRDRAELHAPARSARP